jgi:hypothetical protein
VLRPYTTLKVSLRLPPTINADKAGQQLKEFFEEVRGHHPLFAVFPLFPQVSSG